MGGSPLTEKRKSMCVGVAPANKEGDKRREEGLISSTAGERGEKERERNDLLFPILHRHSNDGTEEGVPPPAPTRTRGGGDLLHFFDQGLGKRGL